MVIQARRALEYLLPENLRFRFTANWALSIAYQLQGDRAAASRALSEALSISQTSASTFSTILAMTHLGRLQELENQLHQAAETYRRVLQMAGDQPGPSANDAYLGLARICYEWNDLDAAEQYAQQSLQLARLYDRVIDRFIISEVFLARLTLARGDVAGAAAMLAETEQSVRQNNFVQRLPEVAAAQVLTLLRQGDVAAAAQLARRTISRSARRGCSWPRGMQPRRWRCWSHCAGRWKPGAGRMNGCERWFCQAVALHAHARKGPGGATAGRGAGAGRAGRLRPSLRGRRAADGGAIVRGGWPRGIMPDYVARLLAAFEDLTKDGRTNDRNSHPPSRERSFVAGRTIEPTRAGNPAADRPGTLEPRDRRAALPGPGHRQRPQPPDLRQAAGATPHRSRRPRPRAGLVVTQGPLPPHSPFTTQNNTSHPHQSVYTTTPSAPV